MTKGPILYAFILPGVAAFWYLGPKDRRALIWSGWWTWLVPLALFATWLAIGCATNPEFYNDVVVREFMSRFDQSLKAHERQQPIWFYFPHVVHKFAPWSLLAIALPIASANVRKKITSDPGTMWLACWALGGLLCHDFCAVEARRPDLSRYSSALPSARVDGFGVPMWEARARLVWRRCDLFGCCRVRLFSDQHRDPAFETMTMPWRASAGKCRRSPRQAGARSISMVEGRDEPMVLYCDAGSYILIKRATREFKNGERDALVLPERRVGDADGPLPPPALDSGPISKHGESRYLVVPATESNLLSACSLRDLQGNCF